MSEMTRDEANAEAVRRIDEAATNGQWWLDLGDLRIVAVPAEIARLREQLRVLALGKYRLRVNGDDFEWDYDGERPGTVSDVGPLQSLTNLTSLNLNGCKQLSDVGPLQSLLCT